MNDTDELIAIADAIGALKVKFVNSGNFGLSLPTEDQSTFVAHVAEAKAIIATHLGHMNEFSLRISSTTAACSGGVLGGPSLKCVSDVEALVLAAVRDIARKARAPLGTSVGVPQSPTYVHLGRIAEIHSIKSDKWDFVKLCQLCRELNEVHARNCYYATGMLVRAITDHVSPVFGMNTFAQVAANIAGSQSFKRSMQQLQNSLRNIADGMLHEQIRSQESLPYPQQVDFRPALDVLLGEVVRIVRESGRPT